MDKSYCAGVSLSARFTDREKGKLKKEIEKDNKFTILIYMFV